MMSSTQSGHTWKQHTKFPTLCPVLDVKKWKGFLQRKGRGTISKIVKSWRGRAQRNLVVSLLGVGRGTKLNRH